MATNTANLGLIKPSGTDKIRIAQINQNMDILDEKIGPVGSSSLQAQMSTVTGYTTMSSGTNLNALTTKANYLVGNISQMLNAPTGAGTSGFFYVEKNSSYILQRFWGDLDKAYRFSYNNGSTWNSWIVHKTEIDSINSQKVAYALGNNTIENIQSAIVTLAGTMADGEIKNVRCNISAASGVFKITAYIGKLMRISSSRLCVDFRESMDANDSIVGNYKDGTWYWSQLQTKIYVLDFYNTATGAYQTDISAGNVIGCHVMNWGSDIAAAIHVGTNDKALIHVYSSSTGAAVTNTSVRLRLYYV